MWRSQNREENTGWARIGLSTPLWVSVLWRDGSIKRQQCKSSRNHLWILVAKYLMNIIRETNWKNSPVQAPHHKFTTKLFCRISIFSRLRTARFALLFRTLRNLSRANSEYCDMNVQRRGSANHSKYSFRCNLHYSHAARCLVTISRTVRTIMGVDNPILAHPV